MEYSPEILWQRFIADIADPPAETAPYVGESFGEVLQRIRELAVMLPPRALRVIDPDLYERGSQSLSERDLLDLAQEHSVESDFEISLQRAREMASEQFAVLDPVKLLSFPYPEIRSILVGRFGANSVAARLKDLFDFEADEGVKAVIVEALHARIHWKEVDPRERHEIARFAHEVFSQGYENGISLDAARTAFYLLRELRPEEIPEALRVTHARPDSENIANFRTRDRIGVVRILGPRLPADALLNLVEEERHPQALEVLLYECHSRWGLGLLPATDPSSSEGQREFWSRISEVMVRRLGFSDVPHASLRILLEAPPEPYEPRWRALLRAIALVALDEGWGQQGLP